MKKEISVKLEEGVVKVKRLQLFDLASALKKVQKIPAAFSSITGMTSEQIMSHLPEMIGDNLEEFADVVSVATDKTKEEIMELGIADLMEVIESILEVNRFEDIKRFLSSIRARGQGKVPQESPSKRKV